jgi:hypothetical protein
MEECCAMEIRNKEDKENEREAGIGYGADPIAAV